MAGSVIAQPSSATVYDVGLPAEPSLGIIEARLEQRNEPPE